MIIKNLDPKKILVGMILLILFFTLYERFTNPIFMTMIGMSGTSERGTSIMLSFISPLIIIGIIAAIMFYVLRIHPINSFMIAMIGFMVYFLFTSPTFFSIIGLSYSEQVKAIIWIDYLRPIVITCIILASVLVLMESKRR